MKQVNNEDKSVYIYLYLSFLFFLNIGVNSIWIVIFRVLIVRNFAHAQERTEEVFPKRFRKYTYY